MTVHVSNFLTGPGGPGIVPPQPPNVYFVLVGVGKLKEVLSSVPGTSFQIYDAATAAEMTPENLIVAQGSVSFFVGTAGTPPGMLASGVGILPQPITVFDWPVVNGIAVSMPFGAGGPIGIKYE